jgi:hypothetical protein
LFHREELKRWGKPGTVWVHPHLHFSDGQAKLQMGYERPDGDENDDNDNTKSTTFQVDAWSGGPRRPGLKCTVSRFIDPNLKLSPFLSTEGWLGLHVQRDFANSGKLQVTVQPTELVDVTWQEGTWTARLEAPLFPKSADSGIRVGLHRSIDLFV